MRQLFGRQSHDTQHCIQPKVAGAVRDDARHAGERLAAGDAHRMHATVLHRGQSELPAQPQAAILGGHAQQAADLQPFGHAPLALRTVGGDHHQPIERVAEPQAALRVARHGERVRVGAAGRFVDVMPAAGRRRVLFPLSPAHDRQAHATAADVDHRLHGHAGDVVGQRDGQRRVAVDAPDAARAGHPDAALRIARGAGDARADVGRAARVAAQARRGDLGAAGPHAFARGRRQRWPQEVGRQRLAGELVGAEAVDAAAGGDPQAAFAILEDRLHLVAAQALVEAEALGRLRMRRAVGVQRRQAIRVDQPRQAAQAADPQHAVAVEAQRPDMAWPRHRGVQRRPAVGGRQRPHALRAVGLPHAAVGALGEPSVADRAGRAFEVRAAARQPPGAAFGDCPQRSRAVLVQCVRGAGRVGARLRRRGPALSVEHGEAGRGAHPHAAACVALDRGDGAGRQAIRAAEMTQLAAIPPADAAEAVADPQAAIVRCEQRRHAAGRALLARRGLEALELDAVETEQSRRAAEPQQAIVGLRDRLDLRGRAVARRPGGVVQLRERERAIERECGEAARCERQAGDATAKGQGRAENDHRGSQRIAALVQRRAPRADCARADTQRGRRDSALTRKGSRDYTRNPGIAARACSPQSVNVGMRQRRRGAGSEAAVLHEAERPRTCTGARPSRTPVDIFCRSPRSRRRPFIDGSQERNRGEQVRSRSVQVCTIPERANGSLSTAGPPARTTALATAGPSGGTPGSPTPVGAAVLVTMKTSMAGIS